MMRIVLVAVVLLAFLAAVVVLAASIRELLLGS